MKEDLRALSGDDSSDSAEITEPRVTSDLLMWAPSFSRWPVAPVASARSLQPEKIFAFIILYSLLIPLNQRIILVVTEYLKGDH